MIPSKKIDMAKAEVKKSCSVCRDKPKVECYSCLRWEGFINRMAAAEIPVDYWFRSMKKFYGFEGLKKVTLDLMDNISTAYRDGYTIYMAGDRGRGKTMAACSILKEALLKGYSVYYITLSDLVTRVTTVNPTLKLEIKDIDFLVIDEIDNRFFPTESSMELYGSQLENVLRGRMQNRLPTIMCSNAVDIGLVFGGQFKKSFQSLWAQFVRTVPVGGPDVRRGEEKLNA